MFPDQALSRILAAQPVLDAIKRDQAGVRTTFDHLVIGQVVTGQVKKQDKGITLVNIEGQTVAMRLPRPVETGDTLKLSFAGHMPQPVFLLDTPETAPGDTPQLSQTARMLSNFMQRVPERTLPTLTPSAPLLNHPAENPAELVLALRTALVRSGLFYESHLANWVVGQDSLDGLMQEPQNRLTTEAARSPVNLATALALSDANVVASEQKTAANPMHILLSQQLQVLESPHFVWRGELWPGQVVEWQLRRETEAPADDKAPPASIDPETGWESRLKLALPRLGTLNVHIKLDANQTFSIRIMPEQAEVVPLLQQHQIQLTEQLATVGCALHAVTVQKNGDA